MRWNENLMKKFYALSIQNFTSIHYLKRFYNFPSILFASKLLLTRKCKDEKLLKDQSHGWMRKEEAKEKNFLSLKSYD